MGEGTASDCRRSTSQVGMRTQPCSSRIPSVIKRGTILIEKGTILPRTLRFQPVTHCSGWDVIARPADDQLAKQELIATGWTLFYMAGEISATAFGFDKQEMMRAALRRLITQVKASKCNCVEIDDVATCLFLGISRVRVSGHSRHIQKGIVFLH